MSTLLLSKKDVAKALTMRDAIAAVKDGYRAYQKGQVMQPDVVSIEVPSHNGETDVKSCGNLLNETTSVKVASGYYDNGKVNDLPTMIGMIVLLDASDGSPLCVMDGSLITNIRTGAAGGVSAEYLARKDSRVIAVIGAGGQARMQVYALCEVLPEIEQVRVYSPHGSGLDEYAGDIKRFTGKEVVICDTVAEAMENADIAVTATPSKEWLISADLVRPGMHLIAVGADMAGKNEWDPAVLAKTDKIVCDSRAQCLSRGEIRNGILAGTITEENIYAEIGELVLGEKPGRESEEEITFFDTTGMGVQDNVTAFLVCEKALTMGLGEVFEFM